MVEITRRGLLAGLVATAASAITAQVAKAQTPEEQTTVTVVKFDGKGNVVTTQSDGLSKLARVADGANGVAIIKSKAEELSNAVPNGTPVAAYEIGKRFLDVVTFQGFVIATGKNAESAAAQAVKDNFAQSGVSELVSGAYIVKKVTVRNSNKAPHAPAPVSVDIAQRRNPATAELPSLKTPDKFTLQHVQPVAPVELNKILPVPPNRFQPTP